MHKLAFKGNDTTLKLLDPPDNQNWMFGPDLVLAQKPVQLIDPLDLFSIKSNYNVTFLQSRAPGRTLLIHRDHQDAVLIRQIVITNDPPRNRHILASHSDIAPADPAVANKPSGHELCRIHRDGKTKALRRKNC